MRGTDTACPFPLASVAVVEPSAPSKCTSKLVLASVAYPAVVGDGDGDSVGAVVALGFGALVGCLVGLVVGAPVGAVGAGVDTKAKFNASKDPGHRATPLLMRISST